MAPLFSPVRTRTAPSPVATNRSSPGAEQALAHRRGAERAGRPFAQEFSDEFGISVKASTTSTHFENKSGWHQVPDVGGKMTEFTPDPAGARARVTDYKQKLVQLVANKTKLDQPAKGGLVGAMMREDRLRTAIGKLSAEIEQLRPVVHRLIQFLPDAERAAALKAVLDGEKLAGIPGS